MTNRKLSEQLYDGMAKMKTNCPNGTMLSAAVLCDFSGKMNFIKWIEEQLDEALDHPVKTGLPAGWIAVADRLPNNAGEYLAAYRNSSGRWSMILDTFDLMAVQDRFNYGKPGQRVWFSNRVPTEPMPIQYWHETPAFPYGKMSK